MSNSQIMEKTVEKTKQLLSVFLYSMEHYDRIARQLPISEGLQCFDGTSSTVEFALASFEPDCVAIDVRLMLQRKYFAINDDIRMKRLLGAAKDANLIDKSSVDDLLGRLESTHFEPIEISLSDDTIISEQYANAEDATYGSLLHADLNHSLRLIHFPREMRLLSLAPYIMARERLLYEFCELSTGAGFTPLAEEQSMRAAVLRWPKSPDSERGIERSPYWSNIVGRDLDEAELEKIADSNALDDNMALLAAISFIQLLSADPLDVQSLRQLVWEDFWKDWGDFQQGASIVRAIENPGGSTKVMHEGGRNYAQVKILPNVLEPWMTDTPQLFRNKGCLVCLTKRKGKWKVNGITR